VRVGAREKGASVHAQELGRVAGVPRPPLPVPRNGASRPRAPRTPVPPPHISPHPPARPRSHTRTARVARDQTPGPTAAYPGSAGPRPLVARETRTSPTPAIPRSLAHGSRGSRPISPSPVVQPVDPWDVQDRSHGRRGPVPSSHKTGSSVVQDASPTVQGASPLLQDVPATGQKPDPHDAVTRLHRLSDSSGTTIKSLIHKTKTRAVRSRGRRCRADCPRSRRRATGIPRHMNPSFPTARSAVHRARTSIARPITPRFPFTGLALSMHGTRLVRPVRRLVRSRGRLVPAEKRFVCSARRFLARRDASSLGEASRDLAK
jgi:hypothetical protein